MKQKQKFQTSGEKGETKYLLIQEGNKNIRSKENDKQKHKLWCKVKSKPHSAYFLNSTYV